MNDPINPLHYKQGNVECIDAIEAALGANEFVGYCLGNSMKYMWRYKHKDGVEDLRKAQWYLNRAIEHEERVEQ